MISTVAIETERGPGGQPVTRSRTGKATACHYPKSGRVILVADGAAFGDALMALVELSDAVLNDEGRRSFQQELDGMHGV